MARGATKKIAPSPEARQLFNKMVARSGTNLHLSLEATVGLAAERVRAGHQDTEAVHELEAEEWIDQHTDGGWLLH